MRLLPVAKNQTIGVAIFPPLFFILNMWMYFRFFSRVYVKVCASACAKYMHAYVAMEQR